MTGMELRKTSYQPSSKEQSPKTWGNEQLVLSKEVGAVSQLAKRCPRGLKVSTYQSNESNLIPGRNRLSSYNWNV